MASHIVHGGGGGGDVLPNVGADLRQILCFRVVLSDSNDRAFETAGKDGAGFDCSATGGVG